MRKELDLEYTQKIILTVDADDFGIESIKQFSEFIKEETLSTELKLSKPKDGLVKDWEFDEYKVTIGLVPI